MVRVVKDNKYRFTSLFNDETGLYIQGIDVDKDPFIAEYPHLIDIGIMGSCEHGRSGLCMKAGIKCYQDGLHANKPNMSFNNYSRIIQESKNRVFQVALGGAGDPDMHEDFEKILRYTRENGIVPNFTTSGLGMTREKAALCKKFCGAVAVSMYSRLDDTVPELAVRHLDEGEERKVYRTVDDIPVKFTFGNMDANCMWDAPEYRINGRSYEWDELHHMYYGEKPQDYEFYRVYNEKQNPNYTMRAIKMLLNAGVKTNIHYVLSNTTIDEALIRLKYNGFPSGINAVVFLLHKPVGLGGMEDVLRIDDPRVKELFELVDTGKFPFKIGFDSCSIPGIVKWSKNIDRNSIDTCEGARFSMYISADMMALPCSFDNQDNKFGVRLCCGTKIEDAWNSPEFEKFRSSLRNSCSECKNRVVCMGGCPLQRGVVLCDSEKKDLV